MFHARPFGFEQVTLMPWYTVSSETLRSKRAMHVDTKKLLAILIHKEQQFFPNTVPRPLKELYLSSAISNFAISALLLFEPIYLYTLGFPLWKIMMFYFLTYVLYFFLMPLGGKLAKRKGFEHGMMYGSVALVAYLMLLLAVPYHPTFFYAALGMLAIEKTLFWPGFHADFAFFSQQGERGREIGFAAILESLAGILGPFLGGVIIVAFGFPTLFIAVCVMALLSVAPLLSTKEQFTPTEFSYGEQYRVLAAPENRRRAIGYLGYAEELIVLTVWPIFIFVTIGNAAGTGVAIALSALATATITAISGHMTDNHHRREVLRAGTLLYAAGWLLRLFVRNGASVFFVDFFSRTSKNMLTVPVMSELYAFANDHHGVVKSVIFFEMALTVGKACAAGFLMVIFFFFPASFVPAFLIGAACSLLYLLLVRPQKAI